MKHTYDIVLINPPWVILRKQNVWRSVASIMPPLGLAWLGAVLERHGHRVRILDAHAESMDIDAIGRWIESEGPFRVAGITATTPLIGNALRTANLIKEQSPNTTVVLGGVHPTVLPEEVLAVPSVDMVVRGEGENTFLEIVEERPIESIAGISWRLNDQICHNPDRALIKDLDSLPFPAYHLLPMAKYYPAAGAAKRLPAISVLVTRGCPGQCTFCYKIFGKSLRSRSGRVVAEEIALLQSKYGIKEVCLYDDTFPAVRKEVRNFCQSLEDLRLDLTWSCFSRIDTFHEETFRMMKNAGCHQVMFGVETCDPVVLSNIKKKMDPEKVQWVVDTCKKLGLNVRLAFMLGNPGETEQSMEQSIRFAIRLAPHLVQFNIATPFPGTEMFRWADQNGYLLTRNWDDYDLSGPVMELPSVSPAKVLEYYRKAHRKFYLRVGFALEHIKKMRSLQDIMSILRGLRMLVGQ
ncbi:MAG: cobalamin-dependent protein [Desulfomonilaceae bacterium]